MSTQTETTCYRHPGRETRVSCSSCGRPICPDCMRRAPSACAARSARRRRTKSRPLAAISSGEPCATIALIVICVGRVPGSRAASALDRGGTAALYRNGALFGPLVAAGDWWRLVTYGFLHARAAGLMHVGFNMLLL